MVKSWLRDRITFLLGLFFLAAFVGLVVLQSLVRWGAVGLIVLTLVTLFSGAGFVLAFLRLALSPPRDWGQELRQREKELAQTREQIFQLTRELRRESDELTTGRDRAEFLRQSFGELARSLDPRRVLDGFLSRAIEAVGARWGSILLLDDRGRPQQSFLSRQTYADPSGLRTAQILDKGLAGWVVRHRRGDIVYDTAQDERWLPFPGDEHQARSAAAVPFLRRGRVLGVMVLSDPLPYHFHEGHLALLEELAQQAAICLENAELYTLAEGERGKLAAILDGTTDAVIVVAEDGQVLLLNRAAERAFGVPAKKALGQPLIQAIEHPALADLFAQARERQEAVTGELTTSDGRVRFCSFSPVHGVGWVAILQDITYLKELDRLKSEFVSTVSHDLRSPLTAVRGYADLVPILGPVNEEQHDALEKIRRSAAQMNVLIEDLLDLGKIEAGIDVRQDPCRLGEIAAAVVDSLSPNAEIKGVTLQAECDDGLPEVIGNAARLRQVVANLVDNAIKYTPSGGRIHVRLERCGREVVCSVTDTGIGIAPQDQGQLFQKFYRVRVPETDGIPGTGLGLAIVRSIVEQHGGRVWVRSALGQGSTFAFALPIADTTDRAAPEGAST